MQYIKDDKLLKKLGKRIRDIRKKRNITQIELGVLCNNYGEQIGRIERGQLNVTISSLNVGEEGGIRFKRSFKTKTKN